MLERGTYQKLMPKIKAMYIWEGKSAKKIAEELNLNHGSVIKYLSIRGTLKTTSTGCIRKETRMLSNSDLAEARNLRASWWILEKIAARFNICISAAHNAINWNTYKDIKWNY